MGWLVAAIASLVAWRAYSRRTESESDAIDRLSERWETLTAKARAANATGDSEGFLAAIADMRRLIAEAGPGGLASRDWPTPDNPTFQNTFGRIYLQPKSASLNEFLDAADLGWGLGALYQADVALELAQGQMP